LQEGITVFRGHLIENLKIDMYARYNNIIEDLMFGAKALPTSMVS
jgi:hypothetical protein